MKVEKLFTLLFVLIFKIPINHENMVDADETIIIPEFGDQQKLKLYREQIIEYAFTFNNLLEMYLFFELSHGLVISQIILHLR